MSVPQINPESANAGNGRSLSQIDVVPRAEFVREFGASYGTGQHVSLIGPTQRGKTRLCHELLGQVVSPDHKAVILAGKPPGRDPVMAAAADRLNLRIVESWPPDYAYGDKRRNGFVLRPTHKMRSHEEDENTLRREFKAAMYSNYAASPKRPVITVVDEAHQVQNDLKLKKEIEAPLMRGAPVNAEWLLIQRNRFMTYHAYSAPEHIFIAYDPDESNRERFAEIGGIDPRMLFEIVSTLRTYRAKGGNTISEFVYIRRSGPEVCIVDVQ